MSSINFYRDQPLFGLDIGHSSLKVMQLETAKGRDPKVIGYGVGKYPPGSVSNGLITNYEVLASSLHGLFENNLSGMISTKRVACTVPTARTFSRAMKLPPMNEKDIAEAVHLEAEQYIPVPVANLYIGYDIARQDAKGIELLMVASPKNIIDSHIKFLEGVGLEPVALEPTMNASSRFFGLADPTHNQPSVLIDIGSVAVDLAVFDQTMFVNSTVNGGNDNMNDLISKTLGISADEAYDAKNHFGIGPEGKSAQIKEAIQPLLEDLVHEVQKIIRYYDERIGAGQHKIVQIITLGGGATMPGLSEYLSAQLNLPTRMLDPWKQIDFGVLPLPDESERPMYVTVAGEALLNPRSILT